MTVEFSKIEVIMAVTGALLNEIGRVAMGWEKLDSGCVEIYGFTFKGSTEMELLLERDGCQKSDFYFYIVTLHYPCS